MSAVTIPSTSPRRVRVPSWLDLRLALGLALVVASVLLGARVVATADSRAQVLVFRSDLQRGTVLTAAEVGTVRAAVPSRAAIYVTDLDAAVGRTLNRAVARGELVARAALDQPTAATALVVPLEPDAAPDLAAGDRVEVWLTAPSCEAILVLSDATVQSAHASVSATFGGAATGQSLVLELPDDLARRVVDAMSIDGARLRAGRLRGPGADTTDLPDLSPCRPAKK
jgi:hypothetical protein